MPKVKNPLFSQEARGGVGGLVYNTWRGINYVKTNTSPTGQGTAKRLAAQARISAISKDWAGLTDTQRANWSQYATDHPVTDWTGSPKRLTGMNWFVACNVANDIQGDAHVTDAPTVAAPDPATGVTLSADTGNLAIAWTAPTDEDLDIVAFLVGPLSAGRTAKLEQAQYEISYDADTTTPATLKAAAPAGRYTVFVKVHDPATGLTSTWTSDEFDMP